MERYYEQLNAKCKEVAKEVIKDNSILSDNMLKEEEKEFLLSDWNAFLIGLISDQSVKAEIAWRLPYYLSKRLGHFDFCKIVEEETVESLEAIIKEKPALHRYPKKWLNTFSLQLIRLSKNTIQTLKIFGKMI